MTGLQLGASSILQLAQASKLKRLTVHQAVQSLVEMGIFVEIMYGKRRLVYPNNYDGLTLLIEEKKFSLRQLEQELESSKSYFDAITLSRKNFSNTRLYHGIEGISTVLLEQANDKKAVSSIYDAHALGKLIEEKIFHRSYEKRSCDKIHTRLILPDDFRDVRHLEWKDDYLVSLRIVAKTVLVAGGIEIWGSKIALHCYDAGQITTTILENKQIANILLMMFEAQWKTAKDYQEQYLIV
jgi:hypothetical protein